VTTPTIAVIPAAGLGTRFLPATKAVPKELLPVVDRPAIQYVVEEAAAAGIDDVCVVTAAGKDAIADHFDQAFELEHRLAQSGKDDLLAEVRAPASLARMTWVRQGEPLGLGHAVGCARHHVGRRPFAVMLPDDLMHPRIRLLERMLHAFDERGGSVVAIQRFPGEAISSYGAVAYEPVDGADDLIRITDVVEKPRLADAPSDLAIVGRYVFTPELFDALEQVEPGAGGEIQLTDAIGLLLAHQPVFGLVFDEGRYDIGKKDDYLRAMVELAAERDDLGPAFRRFLREFVTGLPPDGS
jgi:UTP--glucose-1-phosphate uridylyltransferase